MGHGFVKGEGRFLTLSERYRQTRWQSRINGGALLTTGKRPEIGEAPTSLPYLFGQIVLDV